MGDNLQQLFSKNVIFYTGTPVLNYNSTGTNYLPIYAAPDALFRFGFNWVMVNWFEKAIASVINYDYKTVGEPLA